MDPQLFNELSPKMQTGDLLVFRSDGLIPAIIRKRTRSKWSHVGLIVRLSEAPNEVTLVHASKHSGGVVPILASRELQALKGVAAWVPMNHVKATKSNPNYKQDIVHAAVTLFGLHYNMNTLWRAFLPFLRWAIPAYYDAFCCSFAATHCLKKAQLVRETDITQQELIDKDLYTEPVPLWPVGHFFANY